MKSKISILVTGANGQLGRELQRIAASHPEFSFLFFTKTDLDITVESWVKQRIHETKPDVVINAAAYTNVEKAEEEQEEAEAGNALAPGYLAEACKEAGSALVHVSTDYVFNGNQRQPYVESDEPSPLNVYGKTKLKGERRVDAEMNRYFILRTSWLYSLHGHNFYKTMLRLAKEHGKLRVVNDQIATPTYARILAQDILTLIRKKFIQEQPIPYGLYHYTHEGEASWFDFAEAIIRTNQLSVPVEAVSSSAFPTKAIRPHYSKLDITHWSNATGIATLTWREALQLCVTDGEQ
jgi:dTDP-4-dehydrorhamnose reductase